MNTNERIKYLRNKLELTQVEFGTKTGIAQGHLTSIENGKRSVTDKTIKVICATFSVNEDWLRFGEGEPFIETSTTLVSQLAHEYNLDSLDQSIVEAYIQLPAEYRKGLKAYLFSLMAKLQAVENDADTQEDGPMDNSELMEQARQMVAHAEELRQQPSESTTAKKNA